MSVLIYKILTLNALPPTKATEDAAGFDLYSCEDNCLPPGTIRKIKTGLALVCPSGTYGKIVDRSSVSFNLGLHVLAGVIDADYTGEILIVIHNLSPETVQIPQHMKVAQIIFHTIPSVKTLIECKGDLKNTERGKNGFGSSN